MKPNNLKTFTDYAEDIFVAATRKFNRADMIFDRCKKNSLKAATQKSEVREPKE